MILDGGVSLIGEEKDIAQNDDEEYVWDTGRVVLIPLSVPCIRFGEDYDEKNYIPFFPFVIHVVKLWV